MSSLTQVTEDGEANTQGYVGVKLLSSPIVKGTGFSQEIKPLRKAIGSTANYFEQTKLLPSWESTWKKQKQNHYFFK